MKTNNLKIVSLAIATAITINGTLFAGTASQMQSSDRAKTIQVGPKGVTFVVYKLRSMSSHSTAEASQPRAPKKLIAIDNGYEKVEI